jgi:hypothetical protein
MVMATAILATIPTLTLTAMAMAIPESDFMVAIGVDMVADGAAATATVVAMPVEAMAGTVVIAASVERTGAVAEPIAGVAADPIVEAVVAAEAADIAN